MPVVGEEEERCQRPREAQTRVNGLQVTATSQNSLSKFCLPAVWSPERWLKMHISEPHFRFAELETPKVIPCFLEYKKP